MRGSVGVAIYVYIVKLHLKSYSHFTILLSIIFTLNISSFRNFLEKQVKNFFFFFSFH